MSRHGKLIFANLKVNTAFQVALRNAACELGRSAALPLHLGKEKGEILVAPLQPGHRLVSVWETPLALVAIATGEQDAQSIAWRMQQLYRLTPAESRVAAAMALGQTVEEIAAANRVTEATLRSQLRSIFSKTGTRRQADLVRLALAGSAFGQAR
jgi:DNA-binding CsgD family transcriptional regulator